MKKIIFATGNQDKMREIHEILADMDVEVVSMKEAGIHADIVENGSTFEENAVIKAKTICELTGEITLADDSGLEIDYLDKAPGIYSARFAGEDTSYDIKNRISDAVQLAYAHEWGRRIHDHRQRCDGRRSGCSPRAWRTYRQPGRQRSDRGSRTIGRQPGAARRRGEAHSPASHLQ